MVEGSRAHINSMGFEVRNIALVPPELTKGTKAPCKMQTSLFSLLINFTNKASNTISKRGPSVCQEPVLVQRAFVMVWDSYHRGSYAVPADAVSSRFYTELAVLGVWLQSGLKPPTSGGGGQQNEREGSGDGDSRAGDAGGLSPGPTWRDGRRRVWGRNEDPHTSNFHRKAVPTSPNKRQITFEIFQLWGPGLSCCAH